MEKDDQWEGIQDPEEEGNEEEEEGEETPAPSTGKYDKLLSSDSKKYKLSGMFKDWFLD